MMRKFIFGVIAACGVLAWGVFYGSSRDYQVGRWWEKEEEKVISCEKLNTYIVCDGLFKFEFPDGFFPDEDGILDSSVCVKYQGKEEVYMTASVTKNTIHGDTQAVADSIVRLRREEGLDTIIMQDMHDGYFYLKGRTSGDGMGFYEQYVVEQDLIYNLYLSYESYNESMMENLFRLVHEWNPEPRKVYVAENGQKATPSENVGGKQGHVQAQDVSLEVNMEVSGSAENLETIMRCIAEGDAGRLASMTMFPIERPYPLRDIEDSADMVRRFHQVFDRPYREKMGRATKKDWRSYGWRGYCYGKGYDLWVYDELTAIHYLSPQETTLRNELLKKEKATLHRKLQGEEWVAYGCYKDEADSSVIRIDLAKRRERKKANFHGDDMGYPQMEAYQVRGDEVVRMAIYRNGTKLTDYPDVVTNGYLRIEGSARVRTLVFPKAKGDSLEIPNDMEDGGMGLVRNGDYGAAHALTPVYWLDLIEAR